MADRELISRGRLVSLLENMPAGYGEGKLMASDQAKRIASVVTEEFFLVSREDIPTEQINEDTLTAPVASTYPSGDVLDPQDLPDLWWDNVLATISNFQTVIKLHKLEEKQREQDRKDSEVAFTLFKSLDPGNLHYTSWNHLSRLEQRRWLNVARKAREEFSSK